MTLKLRAMPSFVQSSAHKVPSHLVGFLSRGNGDGASNTNSHRAKASSIATPLPSLRESAYKDAQDGSSKKGRAMRKQHNNGGDDHSNLRVCSFSVHVCSHRSLPIDRLILLSG